jgi:hypothetical protein
MPEEAHWHRAVGAIQPIVCAVRLDTSIPLLIASHELATEVSVLPSCFASLRAAWFPDRKRRKKCQIFWVLLAFAEG